jgi:hypothetical protein
VKYLALSPLGNLLLPTASRRSTVAGLSMWSATRRRARLLQWVYRSVAATLGTGALPGEDVEWAPPLEGAVYALHSTQWRSWFGEVTEMAVYRPTQTERTGFAALLLRDGRAVGFLKCRPEWDAGGELDWLAAVAAADTFMAPGVVGHVELDGWTSVGYEPLPEGIHSPAVRVPAMAIGEEISDRLSDVVATDSSRPRPMHGDMGPWNLRQIRGRVVLFDWEDVMAGPQHADFVFHQVASAAMGLVAGADLSGFPQARSYWIDEIQRRFGGDARDARLAKAMLDQLRDA